MARQSPFMSSAQFTYPTGYQQRDARYATNSTVETAMGLNRRPSLLAGYHGHFSSPERTSIPSYYSSLGGPIPMGPHSDEHSKRSRYVTGGNMSVNSQLLPLSVDVKKEQQVYQPQTEAISPTPDDPKNDTSIRDSTIVRNAISKLEAEIDITMKKLHRAKRSQSEIKSQADRSAADEDEENDDLLRTNGSQTLIEKILHDNRKKAEDSHKIFNHVNNNTDLTMPFYHEASDLESFQKIKTKYVNYMKNHLKQFFKKQHEKTRKQLRSESDQYNKVYLNWQKSIEKEEKNITNKDLTTYRDIFEKTFPELRKTREDKEKKQSNTNDSSTTDQPISLNTNTIEQDTEIEEEKLRKSSVVPPIIYDSWQRKHQYFNHNGLIKRDAAEFYKERTKIPYWSPEEKQIFIEKFTQSPKNFGYISSFLENKTTEQCVQFYYMTKKTENYKNLLRKQSQANRRKAKQTTTTTTTTVTASTTIETTLVTKVTSLNTIVSSTTQQNLGQETERLTDRLENEDERREITTGDGNEEKRANKNRCQLLSCTTDKLGKKKNRKNRLRAFPTKWNELTKDNRETIRRSLQIPSNVQRCCTRCYDKLITQIRQIQTTQEEDEDDDDESSKNPLNRNDEPNSKVNEEWTENEIQAFTEALEKFGNNWRQIAEYVHRSEQSCRAFYQKYRKKNGLIDEEQNMDEDNASISGPEDTISRLTIPVKSREMDEDNDDDPQKPTNNEDSNDSGHGMIIDEIGEQTTIVEGKKSITSGLTTISSLVEKEISKTLHQTEKRLTNTNISPDKISPRSLSTATTNKSITSSVPPPPLVTLTRSRSPPIPSYNQQSFAGKGSIMRGTPISPSTKPISIDISASQSHHYSNPRSDYSHSTSSSTYQDSSHIKSSKILDQQQVYLQQQQQQAAYMRHYPHNNFPTQYLQQQQHKTSSSNNSQTSTNTNKSLGIDTSNTDTYETLRADFVTSRYLTPTTATHSPNHERQTRYPSEQRSPSHSSAAANQQQQLLPPPIAIPTPSSNSQQQQQQQQAVLLAASQMLASSGMYPQELLNSGLLPYSHYYNSLPGASFYVDPRLMHDFQSTNNNEQLKNLRTNRHIPHSPPDPSPYPSQGSTKRHSLENIEHVRYPSNDYSSSVWRAQNSNNNNSSQIKSNSGTNEHSLSKLNELSRHSTRVTSASDRDTRTPDDYHHRINQTRSTVDSPSVPFQRVEALTHPKSSSHEKLHYYDQSSDLRSTSHVHKPHPSHHSTSNTNNRSTLIPPTSSSQISPHHASSYLYQNSHHSPVNTSSSQHHYSSQQRSSYENESIKNSKEPISIGEFMKQSVTKFVASTNNDNNNNKNLNSDLSTLENSNNRTTIKSVDNTDQPICLDVDDDSETMREQSETITNDPNSKTRSTQDVNKSTMDTESTGRRRESSIVKILSNQPLEKPEYVEINQKVQNSTVGASKVHSNTDGNNLERTNSTGSREQTRSRGSITMRMLMGANGIYADGKAQPMTANELSSEPQSNKRAASSSGDRTQSLEYLIRDELYRACPSLPKNDETSTIFHNRNASNRLSPTTQQRVSSKRMRTSPKGESMSNNEQRNSAFYSTYDTNIRDPFVLQTHSKTSHPQIPQSPSSSSSSNADRNWQTLVQQQYQQTFGSRSSRPTNSGSITQGSPISPPTRSTTDQQQYPSTANNQLINPRYSYYMNKNEQQISSSSQSPVDHSPKGKFARRVQQTQSSSSDTQQESSLTINVDQVSSSNLKSPPISASPISSSASPTTSVSSNTAHPLKKRLISEYELEQQQQQRNSPIVKSPTPPSTITEESTNTATRTTSEQNTEENSNTNPPKETEPST